MIELRLSAADCERAEAIGMARMARAESRGRTLAHGSAREASLDLIGAAAELAVAIALGHDDWDPGAELDKEEGDVHGWDVRATEWATGHLLLHPADQDDRPYVLVVGARPWLKIVGWVWGREGKQRHFWQSHLTRRPCFMVPQRALRRFEGYEIVPI